MKVRGTKILHAMSDESTQWIYLRTVNMKLSEPVIQPGQIFCLPTRNNYVVWLLVGSNSLTNRLKKPSWCVHCTQVVDVVSRKERIECTVSKQVGRQAGKQAMCAFPRNVGAGRSAASGLLAFWPMMWEMIIANGAVDTFIASWRFDGRGHLVHEGLREAAKLRVRDVVQYSELRASLWIVRVVLCWPIQDPHRKVALDPLIWI